MKKVILFFLTFFAVTIAFCQKSSDTTVTITKIYHLVTPEGVKVDSVVVISFKKAVQDINDILYMSIMKNICDKRSCEICNSRNTNYKTPFMQKNPTQKSYIPIVVTSDPKSTRW